MPERTARIGITIGDPGGIGPEVAFKAIAQDESEVPTRFFLIGPRRLWDLHRRMLDRCGENFTRTLGRKLESAEWIETADPDPGRELDFGRTSVRHGQIAINAITEAVRLCQDVEIDAMVTAPINKEGIRQAGSTHPGHTEMLAELTGADDMTMAFAGGGLYVALATIHVPLREVFGLISPDLVVRRATHLDSFLRQLGIESPRIALAGLNPHASEGGLFGDEEDRLLKPAVEQAKSKCLYLTGPWPPDTVFYESLHGGSDAVLALYHDQGLIAVKTVAFDEAVNVTLGLPIIRTSPDHGTAFEIAGRGVARAGSMVAAIDLARRLAAPRSA